MDHFEQYQNRNNCGGSQQAVRDHHGGIGGNSREMIKLRTMKTLVKILILIAISKKDFHHDILFPG